MQQQFQLGPFTNTLFPFCGRRRDRIKALYVEHIYDPDSAYLENLMP